MSKNFFDVFFSIYKINFYNLLIIFFLFFSFNNNYCMDSSAKNLDLDSKNIESKKINLESKVEKKGPLYSFSEWKKECKKLPLPDLLVDFDYRVKIVDFNDFLQVLQDYILIFYDKVNNGSLWHGICPGEEAIIFDGEKDIFENKDFFFIQKVINEKKVVTKVHADIHGDIHSLIAFLDVLFQEEFFDDNFILRPDKRLVFLGDYVARGFYGIEVLTLLMIIKILNPDKVFLLRGNHEDVSMNMQDGFFSCRTEKGVFPSEVIKRFNDSPLELKDIFKMFFSIYKTMPTALFFGYLSGNVNKSRQNIKKYGLFCHANIDPGFDLRDFLKDDRTFLCKRVEEFDDSWINKELRLKLKAEEHYGTSLRTVKGLCIKEKEIKSEKSNGSGKNVETVEIVKTYRADCESNCYFWSDLSFCECDQVDISGLRGRVFGSNIVRSIFKEFSSEQDGYELVFCIKGHQHSGDIFPIMVKLGGIINFWNSRQWDGKSRIGVDERFPVFMLNMSPGFSYAVFKRERVIREHMIREMKKKKRENKKNKIIAKRLEAKKEFEKERLEKEKFEKNMSKLVNSNESKEKPKFEDLSDDSPDSDSDGDLDSYSDSSSDSDYDSDLDSDLDSDSDDELNSESKFKTNNLKNSNSQTNVLQNGMPYFNFDTHVEVEWDESCGKFFLHPKKVKIKKYVL